MRKPLIIFLAALMLAAASAGAAPPKPAGDIAGAVVDAQGRGVGAATVLLTDGGGTIVSEIVTAADGSFVLAKVQPGDYALAARTDRRVSAPTALSHAAGATSAATIRFGSPVVTARKADAGGTDSQIAALAEQLAALQRQLNALTERRAAAPEPEAKKSSDDKVLPASAEPAAVLAGALPQPAPAFPTLAAAAPPARQEPKTEQPTLPGQGRTDKGLYGGLAAGAPGERYGRGLSAFSDTLRIGGYGSFRYEANNIDLGPRIGDLPPLQRSHNSFDFRRFVMTMDATPAARLRFYLELEFERFNEIEIERAAIPENRGRATRNRRGTRFIQEIEGTDGSEIALEQAWLQYDFTDNFAARVGVVLVPVGRYNILHDDDYWDIARRPLAVRGGPALPAKSAWRENGAGVLFNKPIGDGYIDGQFYVLNGVQLDFTLEEVVALREGRELVELEPEIGFSSGAFNGSQSADSVAWRLAMSPKLGHEVAFSGYHGRYTPDYLVETGWVNTLAFDGKTTLGNFEVEGEFIYTKFGNHRGVLNDIALQLVDAAAKTTSSETAAIELETEGEFKGPFTKSRKGFWVDFKYRARPKWLQNSFLGRDFEEPQIIPIVRWERLWFDDFLTGFKFSASEITQLKMEDLQQERITLGLSYRPAPSIVFSTAWEHNRRVSGSHLIFPRSTGTDPLSDKSFDSFILGAAFGF